MKKVNDWPSPNANRTGVIYIERPHAVTNRVPKPDKQETGIGLFLSWGRWDLGDWGRGLITENWGEMSKTGMGVSFPSRKLLETPATRSPCGKPSMTKVG